MHATRAPFHALSLDPKRIAATSAAISVHVAVLMMLMMPAQVAPPKVVRDTPMEFVPIQKEIKPIPLLPTPPTTRTETRPQPAPVPVQVPVENTTPSPVDPYVEQVTIEAQVENTFSVDPGPTFAQIRADLAPPPPYPARALAQRLTGLVMLRILVDETGKPLQVVVETSSGVRILDDAAVKFVLKRWHFVPATQDGRAIQAYALVPVSFEMKD